MADELDFDRTLRLREERAAGGLDFDRTLRLREERAARLREEEARGRALSRGQVEEIAKTPADTAANSLIIMRDTGLLPSTIKLRPEAARARQKALDYERAVQDHDITRRFLSDPGVLAIAHDDAPNFASFEGIANLTIGVGERLRNLVGLFGEFIGQTVTEGGELVWKATEKVFDPGFIEFDLTGKGPIVNWRPSRPEDFDSRNSFLRQQSLNLQDIEESYQEMMNWEEFLESPLQNFIPFALEKGLVSLPDMLAVMSPALPAYVAARSTELGKERAKHNGRVDATVEDFLLAAPAAVLSTLFDRIGARAILGVPKAALKKGTTLTGAKAVAIKTGKGALTEAVTESAQEFIENVGSTAGTERGFNLAEALEASAQGFVVGLGFGGSVRAGTATMEEVSNSSRRKRNMNILNQIAEDMETAERAPAIANAFQAAVLADVGAEVQIGAQALLKYAEEHQDGPAAALAALGVTTDALTQAMEQGGNISIGTPAFVEHILGTAGYKTIANSLRMAQDAATVTEAVTPLIENAEAMGIELEAGDVTGNLKERTAELLEKIAASDPVGAAELVQKAAPDVTQVLGDLIAKVETEREGLSELARTGRLAEIDRQLVTKEEQIVAKEAALEAAETAGAGTTVLTRQLGKLEDQRKTLDTEQARLELAAGTTAAPASELLRDPATAEVVAENKAANEELGRLRQEKVDADTALARAKQADDKTLEGRIKRQRTQLNKDIAAAEKRLAKSEKAFDQKPGKKTITLKAKVLDALEVKTSKEVISALRKGLRAGVKQAKAEGKRARKTFREALKASGLSLKEQGKFLAAVSNIDNETQAAKLETRIINAVEKQRVRELKAAIKKVLKKSLDKAQAGQFTDLERKLGIQKILKGLKAISEMKVDEATAELTRREGGIEEMPSAAERMEIILLAAIANTGTANSADLEVLLLELNNLIIEGKAIRVAGNLAFLAEVQALNEDLMEGVGEEKPLGPLAAKVEMAKGVVFHEMNFGWVTKWRTILSSSDVSLVSKIMDRMRLFGEARAAENGRIKRTEQFDNLLRQRFGDLTHNQLLQKMTSSMAEDVEVGTFTHAGPVNEDGTPRLDEDGNLISGKTKPITMTRAELRQRHMEMQNKEVNELSRHPDSEAYTDEIIDAIAAKLNKEDHWIIDATLEFYNVYYADINAAYEAAYGVSLPQIENYVPISREFFDGTTDEFLKGIHDFGRSTPGAFKERKLSIRPLRRVPDIQRLVNHIQQMEYFIAYNKKLRLLNAAMDANNARVITRIETNYGKAVANAIKDDLDHFSGRSIKAATIYERVSTTILRNYSFAQLGLKGQIGLKQLASFTAFAENVKTIDFMVGIAKFIANPKKAIRFLNENSDYFKNRGINIDQDYRDLTKTIDTFLGKRPALVRFIMVAIRYGDKGAIALGGSAHVYAQMQAGKTEQQAIRSFELLSADTQQSSDPDQQSRIQRSNSYLRVMSMFMSSANALMRAEYSAFSEFRHGRISKKELFKRFIIYHILIPNTIQLVANVFQWDDEDQLQASILGSFNGIFVVGSILESIVSTIRDTETFDPEFRHPLAFFTDFLTFAEEFDIDEIGLDDFIEGNRAIDKGASAAGALYGVGFDTILDMTRGLGKVAEGYDVLEGGALALGWSPYTIRKVGLEGR